jgi:hypothetical protein
MKGFLAVLRLAKAFACFVLCLLLTPSGPAYAKQLSSIDEATDTSAQDFGVSSSHSFPLTVWLVSSLNPYMPPTDLWEGLGTLRWKVSGIGKLWSEDPGTLELRFGTLPSPDSRRNFVEYSQSDFRLTVGEQRFSLSPLVRGDRGLGLNVSGKIHLTPTLDLDTQFLAYTSNEKEHFGIRVMTPLLPQTKASINVLASPDGSDKLLSGQLQFVPEVADLETLDFQIEYGLQLGNTLRPRALDLNAELKEGPHRGDISFRQTEAGYRGASHYSSQLEVSGKVQLSAAPEISTSVRLTEEVQHMPQQSLSEQSERYDLRLGGEFSGTVEGIELSLEYDNRNEVENVEGTSRQQNAIDFSVGIPLAEGFLVYQSFEWQQELEQKIFYDALSYNAEVDLPIFGGNVRPRIALSYDIHTRTSSAFDIGADYFGLITDTFDLYASGGLYLTDETFGYLIAGGSYGFENGQALNFDVLFLFFDASEPFLEVSVGYSLPINAPLSY